MKRVQDKVVLITGATGGIGSAAVRKFHSEGALVVITGAGPEEGARELLAELDERATYIQLDVTSEESWTNAVAQTERRFGPVNVLINNAGVSDGGYIHELPLDTYKKVIDVNQTGVFLGMKTTYPSLRKSKTGSIVNVSSVHGILSDVHSLAYVASKFAIRGMTRVAAVEFGRFGIRVNSVHPGLIRTPMTQAVASDSSFGYIPLAKRDDAPDKAGKPEDIANTMLFLSSEEANYINGGEFVVDGGLILNRETAAKELFFSSVQ